MRSDVTPAGFAAASAVRSLPGIRDFDVAHRRDAVLALMPAEGSTAGTATVVVDWTNPRPTAMPEPPVERLPVAQ
jgi:hypothetical protein